MSTGRPDSAPRLVADIGGTNARFALVAADDDRPTAMATLACADYPDFAAAARDYLRNRDAQWPREGFCAIANPVTGDFMRMTNHAWAFSIEESRRELGLERLRFVNDWAAQALAVPYLPSDTLHPFGGGTARTNAPIAVLGPGTGLGVSGLIPSGNQWVPIEGEGGHVSFSPTTELEAAVADHHRRHYGHCSAERIASGVGMVATYRAVCEIRGVEPEALSAGEITGRAAAGECEHCRETVELFCLGLATTASNLAVTLGALGGVYLGGGILPRLGALFDREAFRRRFETKGRFRDYLSAIPTFLVTAQNPALLGLAKKLGRVNG
jgi:glucokinase